MAFPFLHHACSSPVRLLLVSPNSVYMTTTPSFCTILLVLRASSIHTCCFLLLLLRSCFTTCGFLHCCLIENCSAFHFIYVPKRHFYSATCTLPYMKDGIEYGSYRLHCATTVTVQFRRSSQLNYHGKSKPQAARNTEVPSTTSPRSHYSYGKIHTSAVPFNVGPMTSGGSD